MMQALVTLLFSGIALCAAGTIAILLRNDWNAIRAALGFAQRVDYHAPQPPHVRVRSVARRAVMVRMDVPQRRAAA